MELQCTVWNIVFAEGQMPLLSSVAQSIENLKPLLILIPDIKKRSFLLGIDIGSSRVFTRAPP
jgi:hypothetical protein